MTIQYGNVVLSVVEVLNTSFGPKRVKQTVGKRCTMHNIPGVAANEVILDISGRLTASSAANLNTARTNLQNLADGAKHAFADDVDGSYDNNYVIETGSLRFETHINQLTVKFSMRLIEW